ncbi:MAG TPA: biliverdin-producing heme oxygenase [Labilithrix sp.]|jgi:heme oxygenase|nr:biliverdin-producing heme oxygenase [Labilithrix sp.]
MALAIKRLTAPAHRLAEAAVAAAAPMSSRHAYAAYLAQLHGFYAAIEPPLHSRLTGVLPDIDARMKLHRIEADLRFLGAEHLLAHAARCEHTPRIDSDATALGVAYVLEGKTLGARFLLEEARRYLGLCADGGATFFAGYGAATGAMWRSYRQTLETFVSVHGQRGRILRGAETTFACFTAWISALGGYAGSG